MWPVRLNGDHFFQVDPDTPLQSLHFCGLVDKFDYVWIRSRFINLSSIEHKTFRDIFDYPAGLWVSLFTDKEPTTYTLVKLLIQGLTTPGRWQQWLTKGLYDPRLFILVSQLLYETLFIIKPRRYQG